MNEDVLKEIIVRNILGCCQLKLHTQMQILDWQDGKISFDGLDDETKTDLAHYYNNIKKLYYADTKEFLPNVFYVEGK